MVIKFLTFSPTLEPDGVRSHFDQINGAVLSFTIMGSLKFFAINGNLHSNLGDPIAEALLKLNRGRGD